jgi:hypothetical protein
MVFSTWKDLDVALKNEWQICDNSIVDILHSIKEYRERLFKLIINLPNVSSAADIPYCISGVYFYINIIDNEILYIGKSIDIYRRWKTRRDFSIDKTNKLFYMETKHYIDKDNIEGLLILLFAPPHNRVVNSKVNYYYLHRFSEWDKQ